MSFCVAIGAGVSVAEIKRLLSGLERDDLDAGWELIGDRCQRLLAYLERDISQRAQCWHCAVLIQHCTVLIESVRSLIRNFDRRAVVGQVIAPRFRLAV